MIILLNKQQIRMQDSSQLQLTAKNPQFHPISEQKTTVQKYPKQPVSLEHISLRQLRERNKQTEGAINAVKSRINYMKNKQQRTVRKVLNVRRKLTSLDQVRNKTRQMKQQSIQQKRRMEESLQKKSQFNKLIKDHLKYNKKIVMTLMNHKVQQDVKNFKEKQQQFDMLYHIQRDNINEQNAQRANKVRSQHIEAHEKRKLYFLDRLKQFKDFKEKKLQDQIRQRQRQENMIMELQEKQRSLLQRLSVSQKFRMKCQQQYQSAKRKYHSFYEAARGASRQDSVDQDKAQIFIS